jgi:tyrosyl-tRNA synthetase
LSLEEISELESRQGIELNEVKKRLASEVTAMCHGPQAAAQAAETARRTFEEGGLGDGLPSCDIARADLEAGIPAYELFKRAGLADSNGAARKLIKGGGGRLNGEKISDETQAITTTDTNAEGVIKLSAGKKRHALIRPV